MDKKRIIFIINPISGHGLKDEIPHLVHRYLDHTRYAHSIIYTEYPGHAQEIAKQAADDGVDIVVAVGGDGTVNEIARAIVHTDTALAIIPCGSGNGLARHLKIPMNVKGALKIINACEIHDLDYGKINDIPFFCTCGMGFDACVSLKFASSGRRGPIAYIETALSEVIKYKPETYDIEDEDGVESHRAFLITCANASQWGNNAYIAPHASMSDGLMDIIVVEPFTAFDVPALATQLFAKIIDKHSRIQTFQSHKIHIHRSRPGVIHFDGDPIMTDADIIVETVPKGIKMVVNPNKHPDRNLPSGDDTTQTSAQHSNTLSLHTPLYYLREFFRIPIKPF